MKLYVTDSGSCGNNYILISKSGRKLLLDLGCSFFNIKKALDFNLLSVDGCVVTHEHMDHARSISDFEKSGIKVWKPYLDTEHEIKTKRFGDFKVSSFPVPHDNVECRGFLVECDGEKLLYATDFEYIVFSFRNQRINHLLIECNYIDELLQKDAANRDHVLRGHASVEVTKNIIEDIKTDVLKNVILCHLSNRNADKYKIITEIKKIHSRGLWIAEKGLIVDL